MMPYLGPVDAWRRFMAGLTTTAEHFLTDQSEWIVAPMTRWHYGLLAQIFIEGDVDRVRDEFKAITEGVLL